MTQSNCVQWNLQTIGDIEVIHHIGIITLSKARWATTLTLIRKMANPFQFWKVIIYERVSSKRIFRSKVLIYFEPIQSRRFVFASIVVTDS